MIPTLGRARDMQAEEAAPSFQRILVCDEAVPIRRALLDALKKMGIAETEIFSAAQPEEALTIFAKERPTVVFTEFLGVHPEDGLEVVHEMLEREPQTKVVLVTAEPIDGPEVRAAIRAGVFAVVAKPLRHEKIRQVLSDLESEAGGIERFR